MSLWHNSVNFLKIYFLYWDCWVMWQLYFQGIFCFVLFFEWSVPMEPRLAQNSWSSCLSLPSVMHCRPAPLPCLVYFQFLFVHLFYFIFKVPKYNFLPQLIYISTINGTRYFFLHPPQHLLPLPPLLILIFTIIISIIMVMYF